MDYWYVWFILGGNQYIHVASRVRRAQMKEVVIGLMTGIAIALIMIKLGGRSQSEELCWNRLELAVNTLGDQSKTMHTCIEKLQCYRGNGKNCENP